MARRVVELKISNSYGKNIEFNIKSNGNNLVYRVKIDKDKKKQKIYCSDHYYLDVIEYLNKNYPKIKVEQNSSDSEE